MFDLFNSQKAKKYVMGGILVLVSASMLLYLVPNYNTGANGTDAVCRQDRQHRDHRGGSPQVDPDADQRPEDPRGNHSQLCAADDRDDGQ